MIWNKEVSNTSQMKKTTKQQIMKPRLTVWKKIMMLLKIHHTNQTNFMVSFKNEVLSSSLKEGLALIQQNTSGINIYTYRLMDQ